MTEQKLKIGKYKTFRKGMLVNNIIGIYNMSTPAEKVEGVLWYREAHKFCSNLSSETGVPLIKVVGVLAALSANTRWSANKNLTTAFFKRLEVSHFPFIKEKCYTIMEKGNTVKEIEDILNGEKIKAFFLNILHPEHSESVVVDRHAAKIALYGTSTKAEEHQITKRRYKFIEGAYKKAANELNISPNLLQAITWVTYRKNS